jgi:hypothetical protein
MTITKSFDQGPARSRGAVQADAFRLPVVLAPVPVLRGQSSGRCIQ